MNKIAYEYGQRIAMEKMAGFLNVLKPGFEFLGKAFKPSTYMGNSSALPSALKSLGRGFGRAIDAPSFGAGIKNMGAFMTNDRTLKNLGHIGRALAPAAAVTGLGVGGLHGLNSLMTPNQEPTIQQQLMRYMPGMR